MSTTQQGIRQETGGNSAAGRLLLDIATPQMFGRNAFRVTGLPVDAKPREIQKKTATLMTFVDLGKQADIQLGAMSLLEPPTVEQIRDAVQTLKDPERRAIDEFFWFWPRKFGESSCDPALKALESNDATAAFKIWRALENSPEDGAVAMHNIAVLRQLMAIEWEKHYVQSQGFDEAQQQEVDAYWRDALKRWGILLGDDVFWKKLTGRIQQLDDPRLAEAFVQCLREVLPIAVDKVNAELALSYVEQGREDLAKVHVRIMRETSTGDGRVERTAEVVLGPATSRLRQRMNRAKEHTRSKPPEGLGAASELLDQASHPVALYELFFGNGSEVAKEFSDEIAEAAYGILAQYFNVTKDSDGCAAPLVRARLLATSTNVQAKIERFLLIVNRGRPPVKSERSADERSPRPAAESPAKPAGKQFNAAMALLRGIAESAIQPKLRLAKIKKDLLPKLDEAAREEGAQSANFKQLSDNIAVALRSIFLESRHTASEIETAREAIKLALEFAYEPRLKHQLTQDKAEFDRKHQLGRKSSVSLEAVHQMLKILRNSRDTPAVRFERFKKDIEPAIKEVFADDAQDAERLAELVDAAALVLWEISLAAWDLKKDARQNVHKDLRTALAANELAAHYSLETDMRKLLADEHAALLEVDKILREGGNPPPRQPVKHERIPQPPLKKPATDKDPSSRPTSIRPDPSSGPRSAPTPKSPDKGGVPWKPFGNTSKRSKRRPSISRKGIAGALVAWSKRKLARLGLLFIPIAAFLVARSIPTGFLEKRERDADQRPKTYAVPAPRRATPVPTYNHPETNLDQAAIIAGADAKTPVRVPAGAKFSSLSAAPVNPGASAASKVVPPGLIPKPMPPAPPRSLHEQIEEVVNKPGPMYQSEAENDRRNEPPSSSVQASKSRDDSVVASANILTPKPRDKNGAVSPPSSKKADKLKQDIETQKAKVAGLESKLKREAYDIEVAKKGVDQLQRQTASLRSELYSLEGAVSPSSDRYRGVANSYSAMQANFVEQSTSLTRLVDQYGTDTKKLQLERQHLSSLASEYDLRP